MSRKKQAAKMGGVEFVEAVLSKLFNEMETTLTRQEYGLRELVENFDAKRAEIKAIRASSNERDGNRQVKPNATAPHLYSTDS
jgi:hypothetical protein